jgi:hypothetical protein
MRRPQWDDPDSFGPHLPPDYNVRGVFAEGPQPPSNPLAKVQGSPPADAKSGALSPRLARNVLTRAARQAKRLRLALFSHRPKPPAKPIVSSFRLDTPPPDE